MGLSRLVIVGTDHFFASYVIDVNPRTCHRVPVSCFLYYLGEGLIGTGKVCDVSVKGWRIEGDKPVTLGMKLTLRVFLPDQPKPVDVDRASVQWIKEQAFGVRIMKIQAEAELRIKKFVESRTHQPSPHAHTRAAAG